MPTSLDHLPADACLRVIPCHPALDPAPAEEAVAAIAKLLGQWEREGAITAGACSAQAEGAFLVMAWVEPEQPLSGCRKDMLGKVLAQHEARSGARLLTPPPIVLEREGRPRCCTPGELRSLVQVGAVDLESRGWNHLAPQLGAWREAPQPIAEIPWLAEAIARMR